MIYVFDIDGTLCKEQEEWWKYDQAVPILENILKLNLLHGQGHQIIIHTARFEEDYKVTMQWLKKHGVKFHSLVMGKPRGEVYVDSNALRPEEL